MDVCDRIWALYKRVVGIWDGEDGGRVGGADGGGDGEFGVDAQSVGILCAVTLGCNNMRCPGYGRCITQWTKDMPDNATAPSSRASEVIELNRYMCGSSIFIQPSYGIVLLRSCGVVLPLVQV